MARDALLLHRERPDPQQVLRLLNGSLQRVLGLACQVRAGFAPEGSPAAALAWTAGLLPPGPHTPLPLQRLGQPVGTLCVQGEHDPGALVQRLHPLLPTLAELVHEVQGSPARNPGPNPGPNGELVREALAGADTFVWEWWLDTDWLTDIDNGLELLGYPRGSSGHTQDHWNSLIHPDDREPNHAAYLRHERGEAEVYEHAYRVLAADGQWRWMLERGRIVERHPDGRPRRMVGTQTDITQRRALELAAQASEAAQAASRAKTEFLARMSHELRTPLNAVLGFAQLMEIDRDEPPGPGQARRLQLIREAGAHLLHMINDMLDLTRVESGGLSLQLEPVALRELVDRALEMVRNAADAAQVALVLEPGPELRVQADRTRLRQVLLNLLTNAIKYNRPGGRVTVRLQALPDGRVQVAVDDTGVGIGEATLPQVWEPFQRGSQAAGAVEGVGLGLAVTRALVLAMGGEVAASSRLGEGSSFAVRLPQSST